MVIKESLYLQINYLRQAQGSLSMFTDKGGNIFNFRCPYCGDSTKSRSKARGYCYKSPTSGLLSFQCHNCGKGAGFKSFLKFIDNGLYNRYRFEVLKNSKDTDSETEDVMKINTTGALDRNLKDAACVNVKTLSRLHLSNIYLDKRKIPRAVRDSFYFTENFATFAESIGNFSDVPNDPRLLMFETDKFGNIKLVIARALTEKATKRYVTLRVDEEYPKVYGYSKLDAAKRVYVVEGAIDSLFLPNAGATLDANLENKNLEESFKDVVYILDNEPRSRIIADKLIRMIKGGKTVVVFDKNNVHKDINRMVEVGMDIVPYIQSRTFSGIRALLELNKWIKV